MEKKGILGIIFFMFALTLSVVVGPWYLGLPFFILGLVFLVQGFNSKGSIQENVENEGKKK